VTTYEEWRVTGTWDGRDVDVLFSPTRAPGVDPADSARDYAVQVTKRGWTWTVGPHLHKRTVTVTDWTEVDT